MTVAGRMAARAALLPLSGRKKGGKTAAAGRLTYGDVQTAFHRIVHLYTFISVGYASQHVSRIIARVKGGVLGVMEAEIQRPFRCSKDEMTGRRFLVLISNYIYVYE